MDLSILIPARNEQFLKRTVDDVLAAIEAETEIIVVLDGALADPPIPQHPRVTVIYHPVSIGQRAACNEAAKLARGKYVMKVDAHCSFAKGFDVSMLEAFKEVGDDVTMVPLMKNLHAFDWVCPDGHRRYQGPSGPCKECGKPTTQDVVWIAKKSPNSVSYCFDATPHFQYFSEYAKRPEGQGEITETMSLQGSAFMLTREKYFELGMNDETWGSWGTQGAEIAARTWLSGGRVMVNRRCWYAHLFRTQGADFGFPYPQSGKQVEHAKKCFRDLFFENKWQKAVHPLSWLVAKFAPVPGWSEEDLSKLTAIPLQSKPTIGVIYYTDNQLDTKIMDACQKQLKKSFGGEIVSVSLKSLDFGRNIVLPLERGYLTMFRQILAALEASTDEIIFFAEHDCLYPKEAFDFLPPRRDTYYYNTAVHKVRYEDGHTLYVDDCKQLSGLCAYRELLLGHYRERVRRVEVEGFSRKNGFEPGTRSIRRGGYDDNPAEGWKSSVPILDIRHGSNATANRWRKDQFRNQKYTIGWTESHVSKISGWEDLSGIIGT